MSLRLDNSIKHLITGSGKTFKNVKRKSDGKILWRAGNDVTYHVDTGQTRTEFVSYGETCLSPTTFTPTKSGWTFVGWREDGVASSSVLSSKVMGDVSVTLYAVFKQSVTLSYAGNGNTGGSTASESKYRYYNNNNINNPSFTLKDNGFTRTNYTFTGWDKGAVGATITLSANSTATAQWKVTPIEIVTPTNGLKSGYSLYNSDDEMTMNGNSVQLHLPSTDSKNGDSIHGYFSPAIDLSIYTKLTVAGYISSTSKIYKACIQLRKDDSHTFIADLASTSTVEKTVDISSYSGSYQIEMYIDTEEDHSNGRYMYVTKLILE